MELDVVRQELDEAAERIRRVIDDEINRAMMVYQYPDLRLDVQLTRIPGTPGETAVKYDTKVRISVSL